MYVIILDYTYDPYNNDIVFILEQSYKKHLVITTEKAEEKWNLTIKRAVILQLQDTLL
jgi:hypothetical protein